jgi:hypothetical protein
LELRQAYPNGFKILAKLNVFLRDRVDKELSGLLGFLNLIVEVLNR